MPVLTLLIGDCRSRLTYPHLGAFTVSQTPSKQHYYWYLIAAFERFRYCAFFATVRGSPS